MSDGKKQIIIAMTSMGLGGAERCLCGLLSAIDYEKYDVDLFLQKHEGELFPFIDSRVNILPESSDYAIYSRPLISLLREGKIRAASGRLYAKIKAKIYTKSHRISELNTVSLCYSQKYTVKKLPLINPDKKYDLAISFITPHYIVSEKINADKKAAWIHTDYSYIDTDVPTETEMWGRYDSLIAVSESVKETFGKRFPTLKERIKVIEHIIPEDIIKKQSEEGFDDDLSDMKSEKSISLLSVGRFCEAKNFDSIPEICALYNKMCENTGKKKIRWYIVGYGPDEDLIKEKIAEYGMNEYVKLLGKKANPYPYIAECDFYVQPSRFEGKAVTVCEALVMKKKVIIADYSTAKSQINDGIDGKILPRDNEEFARGLSDCLEDETLWKEVMKNVESKDYTGASEIQKLYGIIGEK